MDIVSSVKYRTLHSYYSISYIFQGCGLQRPDVPDDVVASILREHYGLQLTSIHKLPGYDDFTALVECTESPPASSSQATSDEVQKVTNDVVCKAVIKILGADSSSKASYQIFIGSVDIASHPRPVHTHYRLLKDNQMDTYLVIDNIFGVALPLSQMATTS